MITETDLIAMARDCGAIRMLREDRSPNGDHCFSLAQLVAFRAAILADAAKGAERFEFKEHPYHEEAMGCGLEDRDITDRYEAMAYGWNSAMERAAEAIPDDLVPASTVAGLQARIADLERANAEHEGRRVFEAGVAKGLADRIAELEAQLLAAREVTQAATEFLALNNACAGANRLSAVLDAARGKT